MSVKCPACYTCAPCITCVIARDILRDRQAQAIVDRILAEAGCPKKK